MSAIWSIVFVLGIAVTLGALLERFKQSAILGYLLAGVVLGPSVLGRYAGFDTQQIQNVADTGVALLLFTIGLEFNLSRLKQFGLTPWLMGSMQVFGTMGLVGLCLMGLIGPAPAFSIGALVALSSTAVVLRTLGDRGEFDAVHGRQALGVLLFQDVMVVPLMVFVGAINGDGSIGQVVFYLGKELLLAVLFIVGFWAITRYGMPMLVRWGLFSGANREVPVLFAIVAAGGAAYVAEYIGLSAALGAFVVGVMLGESVLATQIRADISGVKTVFVTLFFTSVGLLAEPVWIAQNWWKVLSALLVVVVVKALVVFVAGLILRLRPRQALASGVTVAQIGEFSFVLLAAMAPSSDLRNLVVAATIGSLFVTPYLIASAQPLGRLLEQALNRRRIGSAVKTAVVGAVEHHSTQRHVMVIGFGPAGRAVADRVSLSKEVEVTVLDLNPHAIAEANSLGYRGHVGDVMSAEVLTHAHVDTAEAVVITLPDARLTAEVTELIRSITTNPKILARSRYHRFVGLIMMAGAGKVIDEEETVGQKLAEELTQTIAMHIQSNEQTNENALSM